MYSVALFHLWKEIIIPTKAMLKIICGLQKIHFVAETDYCHCSTATISVAACLPAYADLARLLYPDNHVTAIPGSVPSHRYVNESAAIGCPKVWLFLGQSNSCFMPWTQRPPPFALTTSTPRQRYLSYRRWHCYISCFRSDFPLATSASPALCQKR